MTQGSIPSLIRTKGFVPLWASQCLLSFNDHCFKILVSMLAVELARRQGHTASSLPLVAVSFVLPFLLFSGIAGRLADTISKTRLLIAMKGVEIAAMLWGLAAFAIGSLPAMIAVVFLMGTHSAFYGPARSGFMPELVGTRSLAAANGLFDMGSCLSIVVGMMAATVMFGWWKDSLWPAGVLLVAVAIAGFIITTRLPKSEPAAAKTDHARIIDGLRRVRHNPQLRRTIGGIAGFWFLAALLQMSVLLLAKDVLRLDEPRTGLLLASLAVGIAAGSLLAGRLSAHSIELGLLPIGGGGIVIALAFLAGAQTFESTAVCLLALGISGGLWIVPLDAYLQYRTHASERGRILGVSAVVNTMGTLTAPALIWAAEKLQLPISALLVLAAVVALAGTLWAVLMNLHSFVRFALVSLIRLVYRMRIDGRENIPSRGGALLICNHVTFADGFFLAACTPRIIRFLVIEKHYMQFRRVMEFMRAIPVRQGKGRDVVQMIQRARQELQAGHVVCIFPEGNLTHTGNIMEFRRGMERIAEDLNVPVIPIHLHGLWGSILSFEGDRVFTKWPKAIPYPVRVTIGQPLREGAGAAEAREAVLSLGTRAAQVEAEHMPQLQQAFVTAAKRSPSRQALADSTGKVLSYRETLIASHMLSRTVRNMDGHMIGVILPASVGGALVNIAALMAGKIAVNLNFTSGRDSMEHAIAQCGIQSIITSKAFLTRAKLDERPGMIFVEDLLGSFTSFDKAPSVTWSLLPAFLLRRSVRQAGGDPHTLATVLFSSGSSGQPKGVMMSHANLMSNIDSCAQVIPLSGDDRIAGVLPFFHCFGFNFTLWFPLVRGIGAVYHPNPVDGKGVGAIVHKHKAALLLAAPTFCAMYTRSVEAEQFKSLKLVLVGAEKLRPPVAEAFEAKFGLPPLEGYGATEMAPVICVNTQDARNEGYAQKGSMPGSVGRPVPGVTVRVVDAETFAPVKPGDEGLLLVNGPNRMLGYLNEQVRTSQALVDGWYNTGDIGRVDEGGFVFLTGRLSRFSKIAGEMIPHGRVEEAIDACLSDGARCCVVALPDDDRGERLVALYDDASITSAELASKLSACGLPNLWLPRRDSIHYVEQLPLLGSGKLDMQRAKQLVLDRVPAAQGSRPA